MKIDGYMERTVKLEYPLIMDGEEFKEITLREFGGIDEIELSKNNDAKDDTTLALIFGITRCVSDVPGAKRLPRQEEVGNLPYGELERLAVALRELTLDEKFKTLGNCPACSKAVEFEIVSEDFLVNQQPEYKKIEIPLRTGISKSGRQIKNVTLRPFSGFSMIELGKLLEDSAVDGDKNSQLIYTMVEDIDGTKITREDINMLTKHDRNTIIKSIDIPKVVKPEIEYSCAHCGEDFNVRVWIFDFLY